MTPQERLDASWAVFELAGDTVEATWTPAGGPAVTGSVMLDAPSLDVFSEVRSSGRSAVYRVSEWGSVKRGDSIKIGAVTYKADEPTFLEDGLVARVGLTKL